MRSSKSMPDSNMRKFSKWGSVNTDSGISLFSNDTMTFKNRDSMSISGSSNSSVTMGIKAQRTQMLPPEVVPTAAHSKMAQQLEDVRRFVGKFVGNFSIILTDFCSQIETLSTPATTSAEKRRSTATARQKSLTTRPKHTASRSARARADDHRRVLVL